jgi:hypothetical protein
MAASDTFFATLMVAAAAAGTPRHAGSPPMRTLGLPGPGASVAGSGCATGSAVLAAGPFGI